MTLFKTASVKMPTAGASGITYGGGCWVQMDFDVSTPATWDGIAIDPDGSYFGTDDHIGITVWDTGNKMVQINSLGILIHGGSSVWLPDNYDPGDTSTWNGIVIGSSELTAYAAGVVTFEIDNVGNVVSYGGNFAMLPAGYDPGDQDTWDGVVINSAGISAYSSGDLRAIVTSVGIALYGGTNVWVPSNYNPAVQSTWNGVRIQDSGIQAFKAGVLTFDLSSAGDMACYGGNFALLPAGYDPGDTSTWNGVVINSAGIKAYKAGTKGLEIDNAGSFIFGSVSGKRFMYAADTGVMTIEPDVLISSTGSPSMSTVAQGAGRANTALNSSADYIRTVSTSNIGVAGSDPATGVIFDKDGLRGFAGSVKKFEINASTGSATFAGDLTGANITAGGDLTLENSALLGSSIIIGDGGTISTGTDGQHYLQIDGHADDDSVLFIGELYAFASMYTTIGSGGYTVYAYNVGGTDYELFSMAPSGIFFRYKTEFRISDHVGTQRVSIDSTGNTTLSTGNLVIGTAGKGIDFSASADTPTGTVVSQLLDDYETGTWTIGLTFGGGATGMTKNYATGTYTKIGKQVHIYGFLQLSAKGSSTGVAVITGLPFTCYSAIEGDSVLNMGYINNLTFSGHPAGVVLYSTATAPLFFSTSTVVALLDSNFANNSEFVIQASYMTS